MRRFAHPQRRAIAATVVPSDGSAWASMNEIARRSADGATCPGSRSWLAEVAVCGNTASWAAAANATSAARSNGLAMGGCGSAKAQPGQDHVAGAELRLLASGPDSQVPVHDQQRRQARERIGGDRDAHRVTDLVGRQGAGHSGQLPVGEVLRVPAQLHLVIGVGLAQSLVSPVHVVGSELESLHRGRRGVWKHGQVPPPD
jgi:hypothetical protein